MVAVAGIQGRHFPHAIAGSCKEPLVLLLLLLLLHNYYRNACMHTYILLRLDVKVEVGIYFPNFRSFSAFSEILVCKEKTTWDRAIVNRP